MLRQLRVLTERAQSQRVQAAIMIQIRCKNQSRKWSNMLLASSMALLFLLMLFIGLMNNQDSILIALVCEWTSGSGMCYFLHNLLWRVDLTTVNWRLLNIFSFRVLHIGGLCWNTITRFCADFWCLDRKKHLDLGQIEWSERERWPLVRREYIYTTVLQRLHLAMRSECFTKALRAACTF